jgi:serine/threonine protein kinase
MIDHYFDEHQLSNENSKITSMLPSQNLKKTNKKNSVNSAFIKSGEYLKEIKSDPYFKFENFEKVKMGKKMQVLGAGAFGDVYLVKNKLDGKFFAVKQMYKKRILETGAKLDIVRREIDIHSRLIHPNIIKLYSYHEDELAFYLILEYANSGTLFTTIRKSKGLEEKNAFNYFIQVATAINFIHENNLIHRDIKPENLLIDENNNIKLCDFGWCIELEIGNRTTFCGTIEYMAPEIIKEMPYDKSIDVWSLGILLYELIHGYSPFRADGDQEEEHTQIFKNIIKFKFKIDKPNLSKSCMDIITSKCFIF